MIRATLPRLILLSLCLSCATAGSAPPTSDPFVIVLGTAQDGGYPQAGTKPGDVWNDERRMAASLGIVDPQTGERWLIEATPDFREQLHQLDLVAADSAVPGLDGIFITHAHVGHYAGLIHLGREIIGAREVPVYAMPRLAGFLAGNGPWSQLVELRNISVRQLAHGVTVQLNSRISITPLLVPHRDEYSETVGFIITGPTRRILFLPDIDKWEKWDTRIEDVIGRVDVAYIDGTFYQDGEIPGRAMAEIPHPFITETLTRITSPDLQAKIRFIHLNRTNPAAFAGSAEQRNVLARGFGIARALEVVRL